MIVTRKDGKWRVTALSCGYMWRAEKLKDNGELADNKLTVTLNKEQWDKWRVEDWMKDFKGTPGSWKYRAKLGEVVADGGVIAEVIVNGSEDENGVLMASAPLLLQALLRLESWASTMHGHGVEYSGDHPIAFSKAAIAKALGESQ